MHDNRRTASKLSTNVGAVDGARSTANAWQTWTCGCGCMIPCAHATMFVLYLLALMIVFVAIRCVNVVFFELRSRDNQHHLLCAQSSCSSSYYTHYFTHNWVSRVQKSMPTSCLGWGWIIKHTVFDVPHNTS